LKRGATMHSTNGHGSKRAILYARVSTDEQARSGYSLAQQLEALREHAAREGYEVLEEVSDPGQSGAMLARPGLDRVRDLVAAGGVSVVLAQDRDRFAREPAYHYLLRQEFEEHGTKIRALNDRGDESPEGDLTDGILDQLGKYERAKTAERMRRGKLKKVREGKVVGTHAPRYGFRFNDARDAYEVSEAEMEVVRRIFYMVGTEGQSLRAVAKTFEREGLPTPKRAKHWNRSFLRACIRDDVYRPHTFEEVKEKVVPHVAARLDPNRSYGLWWFNRLGHKVRQVSEPSGNGRRYRKTHDWYQKPKEEWIAVPVPDSGISRGEIAAARAAIEGNRVPARAGRRFWELTGGISRCGECGWTMCASHATTTKRGRTYAYDYYRCSNRDRHGLEACVNSHKPRADKREPEVWAFVSNLLKSPDLLRAGLEKLIEDERKAIRGNPSREAEMWAKKLSEVERKRSAYQDQQAEGLITLDELRTKLAALEETRTIAQRELAALKARREIIEDLERDAETLLEHYASMVPEALDDLTPEERHRVYKMLRLNAIMYADGRIEIVGAFAGLLDARTSNSVETESTSSSTATSPTSRRRGSGSPTA
jgi:site-specific DNA recombinase